MTTPQAQTIFLCFTEDFFGGTDEQRKVFLTLEEALEHKKHISLHSKRHPQVLIQEIKLVPDGSPIVKYHHDE
ncbi:MAG: hypothetical protein Sylvanvirus3_35 [Sylvanvirus sp.]|uniref:Uncharacterized protein n=1 Tax=Sylvanvirus sp. TaxID=2487774 RepID=A0A3G5AJH5_9VIRU|nr:MAG: hypothetical protein Sylvanvirus3_35 [Sylvanvirus sp.]